MFRVCVLGFLFVGMVVAFEEFSWAEQQRQWRGRCMISDEIKRKLHRCPSPMVKSSAHIKVDSMFVDNQDKLILISDHAYWVVDSQNRSIGIDSAFLLPTFMTNAEAVIPIVKNFSVLQDVWAFHDKHISTFKGSFYIENMFPKCQSCANWTKVSTAYHDVKLKKTAIVAGLWIHWYNWTETEFKFYKRDLITLAHRPDAMVKVDNTTYVVHGKYCWYQYGDGNGFGKPKMFYSNVKMGEICFDLILSTLSERRSLKNATAVTISEPTSTDPMSQFIYNLTTDAYSNPDVPTNFEYGRDDFVSGNGSAKFEVFTTAPNLLNVASTANLNSTSNNSLLDSKVQMSQDNSEETPMIAYSRLMNEEQHNHVPVNYFAYAFYSMVVLITFVLILLMLVVKTRRTHVPPVLNQGWLSGPLSNDFVEVDFGHDNPNFYGSNTEVSFDALPIPEKKNFIKVDGYEDAVSGHDSGVE